MACLAHWRLAWWTASSRCGDDQKVSLWAGSGPGSRCSMLARTRRVPTGPRALALRGGCPGRSPERSCRDAAGPRPLSGIIGYVPDQDDAPLAGLRILEISSFVAAPLG